MNRAYSVLLAEFVIPENPHIMAPIPDGHVWVVRDMFYTTDPADPGQVLGCVLSRLGGPDLAGPAIILPMGGGGTPLSGNRGEWQGRYVCPSGTSIVVWTLRPFDFGSLVLCGYDLLGTGLPAT